MELPSIEEIQKVVILCDESHIDEQLWEEYIRNRNQEVLGIFICIEGITFFVRLKDF